MYIGVVFWILMLIWIVFQGWTTDRSVGWTGFGGSFLLFVLLCLLGWHVFGPAIHG